jgi:putative phosphoserine phosphatase/1-acylglycerol-3-phosphate O-acyltransferase
LLNVVNPPTIRVRVGQPLHVSSDDHDANTHRLMGAIRDQLPIDAQIRRTPTAEELKLSYPPGYKGDPTAEVDRRPGAD